MASVAIDIVFKCTGVFNGQEDLQKHLQARAEHVILSAPPEERR